ncbi:MAG TPA: TIGR03667 family PPOX class F420-dependent oxidoreductase [Solirubrobacteraceae bacterium]|nr:TIGR03667 family PPOX class F420-dependent oxidoreductase [Solirubrobacteraceae bacterium]
MSLIDQSTEFGARAARHLREDRVVWLTTVTASGAPVPNPVWFLWDGEQTIVIFSLPDTGRVRNVQANPRVALHFDGDGSGGDVVVLSGRASAPPGAPSADQVPDYLAKYEWGFERLGTTPAQFAQRYSVPVHIELTRLRGH